MPMLRLFYLLTLLLLWPTFSTAQELFVKEKTDGHRDALQEFRQLLSERLNPSQASIERVFNPLGDGESLLIRAYITGPEELVFRPLFDENLDNAQESSFLLRTLPGTELKEVLINFEPSVERFQLYFGKFHYSVSPDMTGVSQMSARLEASPFLADNFQTLFIDQPAAALGIRYLTDQQNQLNQTAVIQLRKEYRDNITDQLLINSHGEIVNAYRLAPYQNIAITPVYFLEQYNLDNNQTQHYYIQSDGLKSFQLDNVGQTIQSGWISRQSMQPVTPSNDPISPTLD